MLKKISKKALSFLLVFVLLVTTFFIFDPSILLPKSNAVVDVKKLNNTVEPTVKFYVPEAIYLNPVIGSGDKPYSFQYFIDCDENGTLRRSATQNYGTVYFSCSAACSSIKISWENSNPTVTTNTETNQIVKQTITGGTTSVKDGRVKVTCTYVVDGKTRYAYAYTYMYYPDLDLLTGVAGSYGYITSIGNEPYLNAFAFITGVHYVGNVTNYSTSGDILERGVSNYYDQYSTSSSKGAFGLSPLMPNWKTDGQFKTGDKFGIYDNETIYGETNSSTSFLEGGNGGVYFRSRERDGSTARTIGSSSKAWGTLYVDTSRVTNFNQIPNLRGGFICHYYQSSGEKGKLNTFQTTDGAVTITSNIDYRNGDGKPYGMTSSEVLTGTPPSSSTTYTMQAHFQFQRSSSSTVNNYYQFGFKVNPVNKASLRNAYRLAIENGWQSETASTNGWSTSVQSSWKTAYNNFTAALETAGTILGKPYATATEVSNALSNLNTKVSACNTIINANFTGGENSALLPQVYFYVPETVYLNPSDNQTFQYFYGVDTSGNSEKDIALSTAAGGARIYFAGKNCTPTSVKITVASSGNNETNWNYAYSSNLNTITYGGTAMTGSTAYSTGKSYSSFPVNIQCTAGKMNAAVTASNYRFMRWTAEYVVGGITYKTYAYTTVYSPYDKPAAAAVRVYNERGVESDLQQIAWISGIVSCGTNGNRTNNTTNFDPIRGVVLKPTNTENNGGYSQDDGTYINGSSGTGYFVNRQEANVDQAAEAVAPTGQLVLDSTRFSNLQYVPNLKIGFLVSYVNEGSANVSQRRFGYYFSDVSSISYTSPSGKTEEKWDLYYYSRGTYITSYTTYENYESYLDRSYCYPRQVYNGTWNKEVTSSTTVIIKGASRFGIKRKSNDRTSNSNASCVVPVYVNVVNKSSLRSRYYDAISTSKQQDWYAAGYDNYQNSILTMALNLEHPARTTIDSTVNNKDLVTKSGTTTAVHLRAGTSADYNGNVGAAIIGTDTESKSYTYGDRVYGYYNEIPGFTKSNYSVSYGSTTKTSNVPQDSTYNNYFYINNANTATIQWKFWYTPNTYNIKYDPNGGTYNGTTGLTSSSVLFQSKYTVGLINSATPANPTRAGCTFMGWRCSADGLIYNAGDTINWEFLEDVTFTAQWEYNSINLLYNENHDSLAPNIVDPSFDGTLSYDSTATITSTNDAGETVTTTKACNLTVEKLDDGTIRINGALAGNYTFGFVPFDFEDGKEYVFSNNHISGSLTNGCMVIDPALSDGNNVSPRNQFDFSGNGSKTITPDSTYAGYRFWIWHNDGAGSYMTFNNYTFKPRIELKSSSTTVPSSSTDYNNIFSEYIQYDSFIKELPTPTRIGYTFDGWYTKAEGGTKVNVGDRLLYSEWNLDNDKQTLYAHWTINTYKLMYENEFDFDSVTYTNGNGLKDITADYANNTLSMTSTATNCYISDGSTRMKLIGGHTYKVTFNFTSTNGGKSRCTIMPYSAASGGTWGSAYYTENLSSGGTFTVNEAYPYVFLRFGISCSTTGINGTYSDIHVQDLTDPMGYRSSFDSKDPSLDKKFDDVTYNTTQSPLATISRQGYNFVGWYQSQNATNGNGYGTRFTTSTKMPAKDVQLYAMWALKAYAVTIDPNADSDDPATLGKITYYKIGGRGVNQDGSITTSKNEIDGGTVTNNLSAAYGTTVTLSTPTRTGYEFTGWEIDGTTPDNGSLSGNEYKVGAGAVTIKATWTKKNYTVTAKAYSNYYKDNAYSVRNDSSQQGGSVKISWSDGNVSSYTETSATLAYRTVYTLTATAKAGYKFNGWYKISDNTKVTENSTYSATLLDSAVGYYAKFSVQSYSITIDPDNATTGTTISGWYSAAGTAATQQTTTTSTKITMVYGSTVTMTAPKKTGYTFNGWERTSGTTGTLTSSTTGNSTYLCGAGDATIKAKWTEITYTITFDPAGGSVSPTDANYTIVSTTVTLPSPSKSGYTFAGWLVTKGEGSWTNKVEDKTLYNSGSLTVTGMYGNATLTAQWIYTQKADDKTTEYGTENNSIEIVLGVNTDGSDKTTTTTKYDETGWKNYQSAIEAYKNALGTFKNDVTNTTNKSKLEAAIKTLTDITLNVRKVDKSHIDAFYIKSDSTNTYSVKNINLNHYITSTLTKIKDAYTAATGADANALITSSVQKTINDSVRTLAEQYINKDNVTTTPSYKVYENGDKIKDALGASNDIDAVNYVRTVNGSSIYYCYTNKTNPQVYLTVEDSEASSGRICYPTRSTIDSNEAENSILNKLDGTVKADYEVSSKSITNSVYESYIDSGLGGTYTGTVNGQSFTGKDYYNRQSTITLKPVFTDCTNAAVKYVITSTDDSYNKEDASIGGNYAKTASLSAGKKDKDFEDSTLNSITIIIDYHKGDQLNVTSDQVDADKYLKQFHLFRNSGGARNWELPYSGDENYTVNDSTYGQKDYGSFTYTFVVTGETKLSKGELKNADVETLKAEFQNFDPATAKAFKGTNAGGDGLGYIRWGTKTSTNWSFNYYPKSNAYTYVHLVDRWGNVVDKVIQVPNLDSIKAEVLKTSSAGVYEILEAGGSGIDSLSLNAASMEILTDENSTLENNVYKTTGNTIKIKTGEANKSYTLTMKDKATNASTAALTSDENGIITLNVTDEEYTSGVYTFTLNGIEINLYDSVNNDKYIVSVTNGEAEEGEYAELSVITTGEVGKIRFTDTDGNAVTIASCNKNADGTKTWAMSKKRSVGEYEYDISVKVGNDWIEESSKGKLTFTAKILDSGLIRSAEYDAESGLYKITIEGRATKIQFITEDGMTRTYTRYNESVKSVKTYDAEENEVNDTARTLDHEVWLVNAKLYSGLKYTVAAKFEAGWNMDGTTTLTAR